MSLEVDEETVGMRAYHVKKARASERAVDRMRQALGTDWSKQNNDDVEKIRWVLGDLWAFISRADWENIFFSEVNYKVVSEIRDIAQKMLDHEKVGAVGLLEIHHMLKQIKPQDIEDKNLSGESDKAV